MAVAMLFELPGATQQDYDRIIAKLNLGGRTTQGGIFHVAGPMEGGWRFVDVWESQEAAQTFYGEKLGPVAQELGLPAARPKAVWPVHNILTP